MSGSDVETLWPYTKIEDFDASEGGHAIAGYCNGTSLAMYVDGKLVHTAQAPGLITGGTVGIVARSYAPKSFAEFHNVLVNKL